MPDTAVFEPLLALGPDAPPPEMKAELARSLRARARDGGREIDRLLFTQQSALAQGLTTAQETHDELRALVEQLRLPPWYPALFLGHVPTAFGTRAMVHYEGTRRLVAVHHELDADALVPGDEVLLDADGEVVTARSSYGTRRCGETGTFQRSTSDGRCVIRSRDEELVVEPAGTLAMDTLQPGDILRWDRTALMALERLEAVPGTRFLLEEVADIARSAIGGQDAAVARLLSVLRAALVAPEVARRYGLGGRRAVLLTGPPGVGKTLMARVVAAELRRSSGRRCGFAVVKPAEWESAYVGATQENIRACFRALQAELTDPGDMAVLFLDEIEAIGRVRGIATNHHSDKFLAALLAELDGFAARANIAVIAASNRKDLIDPALLERLSDVEIAVRRPDLRGARAIFGIHLPEGVPITPPTTREELIEQAVSRLYSPNADNTIATLRFRDGTTRVVAARELASGRLIGQICRAVCQRALDRELDGHGSGIAPDDVAAAVAEAIERLGTTLHRANAHAYLDDLPQDLDIVAVEPARRLVPSPEQYHDVP